MCGKNLSNWWKFGFRNFTAAGLISPTHRAGGTKMCKWMNSSIYFKKMQKYIIHFLIAKWNRISLVPWSIDSRRIIAFNWNDIRIGFWYITWIKAINIQPHANTSSISNSRSNTADVGQDLLPISHKQHKFKARIISTFWMYRINQHVSSWLAWINSGEHIIEILIDGPALANFISFHYFD